MQVLAGHMVGYAEDCVPLLQLYTNNSEDGSSDSSSKKNSIMINRELVEAGVASWIEMAPLESATTPTEQPEAVQADEAAPAQS